MKALFRLAALLALASATCGCGTTTKQQAAESTLSTMGQPERLDSFEATARVLDDHPEYVAELYGVLRRHPKAMTFILQNTVADLEENAWLGDTMATLVSKNPRALEKTLLYTVHHVHAEPQARPAMRRALTTQAALSTS